MIIQTGVSTGNNKHTFIATGTTVTELAELNENYVDPKKYGPGSSCMMKETRDLAEFDGTEWFIW